MRQRVTIEVKIKFTKSQIHQLWNKFNAMYGKPTDSGDYYLGRQQDRFHKHCDISVDLDTSEQETVATLHPIRE